MAETKVKLSALDPVWTRVREEAFDMVRTEPLLGGLIHSSPVSYTHLMAVSLQRPEELVGAIPL